MKFAKSHEKMVPVAMKWKANLSTDFNPEFSRSNIYFAMSYDKIIQLP